MVQRDNLAVGGVPPGRCSAMRFLSGGIHDGRLILGGRESWLPDLLGRLPAGLMFDVGAGAGHYSRIMLESNLDAHVIAFEPFRGNWLHFERNLESPAADGSRLSDRVELRRMAVCDQPGEVDFDVSAVVPEGENGAWGDYVGYSSLGRICNGPDSWLVPATTIDAELGDRTASFVKIDVQGAEASVLRGAKTAIRDGRILALLVEYSGRRDVLRELRAYRGLTSEWTIFLRSGSEKVNLTGWEVTGERILSTGRPAVAGWPVQHSRFRFGQQFNRLRRPLLHLETDLLFLHPRLRSRLPAYFTAR